MKLDLLDSPFDGRSLIEASAGTGKTWTLTALYARLLLERQLSVGQILVVTYTTAATAELRERIRARLADLLAVYEGKPSEDDFLNRLHARYPDEASRRRLLLAVHGFDEAAIFTIHGFCQRALQDAAFEAGGDFDSELTADDREIIDALLADAWRSELADADPVWARFLAKSRITPVWLRQRLRSHLGKPYLRVEPQDLPVPTDLRSVEAAWQRAAGLWQEAGKAWVAELVAHGGLNQSTHKGIKFTPWQVELDAYFADPAAMFDLPEGAAKFGVRALSKACKKGFDAPVCELAHALDELADQVADALPAGKQRLIALQVALLERLNRELPERKAAQRLLAFDDLLNRLDLALQGPVGEDLAASLRATYPLALIDEFQDTDPIQYAIFNRIYAKSSEASLCFVGDPKQAIYAFRGADLATYMTAKQQADREPFNLPTNYRSTPELIAALNQLFKHPQPFAQRDLQYPPVGAAEKPRAKLRLVEEGEAAPLSLVWLGDDPLGKGEAAQLAASDTARRIALQLAGAGEGRAGFDKDGAFTALKGGDIAVLVANHRQAGMIADELSARGVPSVRRGRDSVWRSEEATELAAVLAAYAEPGREGLLRYALATRLLGRSAADLARCQDDQQQWDAEREAAERYHQLWQQQGFMRVFRAWLDEQAVAERLLARVDGERRLTNLLHLGELLQAESLLRPGLEPLLAWFNAQRGSEGAGEEALLRLESDAERVQIVTIHTSKGLEYPLVFCPFLWDGKLLGKNRDSARCHDADGRPLLDLGSDALQDNLERAREEVFAEQLRLAYVALTRARDRLWLHWGPVNLCKPKKDGSLADEGLHSSALAWLLHGRDLPGEHPLTELGNHLADLNGGSLRLGIERLIEESSGHMACLPLEVREASAQGPGRAAAPQQLSQLTRSLHSAWRIGSFSGLAAGMHMEAPDRDALAIPDAGEPGSGFFAFPRGARAGTCLHAILEDWARGKGDLPELVEPALQAYGLPLEWKDIATTHLQGVLETDLDSAGLTLARLQSARRLPELGFTFPVQELDVTRLRTLLTDPDYGLAAPLREAASRLEFDSLKGFLKGFIDLTFEHDGRWYIADYKSNWLGPDASYYGGERLLQALAGEHYYLQYLIYLVALRRFLRQRLADFRDDQLGGAFYLFLRGMPDAGVYFARPRDALLDALDRLFEEER
ncbi:exodeoxyribonuclease V subunit beta [Stutzerimonas stutzeri ATCC 14405 = CCUG 16156]|uniref:exodeoxyribonuclease V subunit beta n=1 Tax=Stutzerimonas stutzeri TaxID=316 RepID=UPI0002549657|nr:exodeoxyribonuclease V subunit beta [Stutzerimonas stutzeri]EHY77724.1 exodeoxyribonuclease V subunit beta [Stutzerimonas stutzeri ATCC 14405 = CCUG 16156]QOZ94157.1 exodeoxyribonuclease V subunit beta [Stutzerimonas stutzeri]